MYATSFYRPPAEANIISYTDLDLDVQNQPRVLLVMFALPALPVLPVLSALRSTTNTPQKNKKKSRFARCLTRSGNYSDVLAIILASCLL